MEIAASPAEATPLVPPQPPPVPEEAEGDDRIWAGLWNLKSEFSQIKTLQRRTVWPYSNTRVRTLVTVAVLGDDIPVNGLKVVSLTLRVPGRCAGLAMSVTRVSITLCGCASEACPLLAPVTLQLRYDVTLSCRLI